MTIKIITVGNKSSRPHQTIIDDYLKRFPRTTSIKWVYIKHSNGNQVASIAQESENILNAIDQKSKVLLLDETGTQLTSPKLSDKLFAASQDVTFIIGGAYGVSDEVKNRADIVLSLSKFVFPHQLVRVILSEQLYRAYTISINHPYHHS
jgi:23S rRNA (pseudouridine1915-N3)-methyltransferase